MSVQYKVDIVIILSNVTCSRHDIAKKLLNWHLNNNHSLTLDIFFRIERSTLQSLFVFYYCKVKDTFFLQDAPVGTTVYADLRVTDVDYTNSVLNVTCDPSITSLPQVRYVVQYHVNNNYVMMLLGFIFVVHVAMHGYNL